MIRVFHLFNELPPWLMSSIFPSELSGFEALQGLAFHTFAIVELLPWKAGVRVCHKMLSFRKALGHSFWQKELILHATLTLAVLLWVLMQCL
jgi:hypothetical protein